MKIQEQFPQRMTGADGRTVRLPASRFRQLPLLFVGALFGFSIAQLLNERSWRWPWFSLGLIGFAVALLVYMRQRSMQQRSALSTVVALSPPSPQPEASAPLKAERSSAIISVAPPVLAVRARPKIVAIGGGTGMPQLLRGLRTYTDEITAIVTVADDGGSSGRLRQQMGVLPPGDFRNNIAALSQAEELMTRLFQYRFATGEIDGKNSELAGHSFGNLFITTMAAVSGSFEAGLAESSRVLAVRGRVLPSTLEHINLCAEVCFTRPDGSEAWQVVEGESNITKAGGRIMRVFLKPETPRAYPEVIRAILQADLIVAGPGSFFTSVMPNLLVPAISAAICAARAPRIYLCNVATQTGETDGYSVSDHMRQLRAHAGDAFTTVLANHRYDPAQPPASNAQWVPLPPADEAHDYRLFTGDVVDETHLWRHNSTKLAARLMEIYTELRPSSLADSTL